MKTNLILPTLLALNCAFTVAGTAAIISVNAADNIYGAGQASAPGGGNVPGAIALTPVNTFVTFSSVTGSTNCTSAAGCITINSGTLNDPDGVGAATATSSNTGTGNISGIASAPGTGFLVGVFVPAGGPSGPAPAALNFSTGSGTAFTSLSPLLDQTFFIGDGLTGDGSGTQQRFNIPTGAASLYLGISDAPDYNGSPGSYGDNCGSYTVNYNLTSSTASSTPEPGSFALLGSALAGLSTWAVRRRRSSR